MAPHYVLYTYFRSSCSARVRIAAVYKGIPLEYRYINLLEDEQNSEDYSQYNSSHTVPTLLISNEKSAQGTHEVSRIQQSVAILEYWEDCHPDLPALLPRDPKDRALVRQLVNIIACDVQPVTNLKILSAVRKAGIEGQQWQNEHMTAGLAAYEQILVCSGCAGICSVGDNVTLADVVLAPAVEGALRFDVDVGDFPNVQRIYKKLQTLPAFVEGGWRAQLDTPEGLR
jgi:maleylacetoacetate isomerase